VIELLDALQKAGTLRLFLAAIYQETKEHRGDVAAEILRVRPEAADAPPKSEAAIEVQKAGKAKSDVREKASAPRVRTRCPAQSPAT
jgi:hypothetical protein